MRVWPLGPPTSSLSASMTGVGSRYGDGTSACSPVRSNALPSPPESSPPQATSATVAPATSRISSFRTERNLLGAGHAFGFGQRVGLVVDRLVERAHRMPVDDGE